MRATATLPGICMADGWLSSSAALEGVALGNLLYLDATILAFEIALGKTIHGSFDARLRCLCFDPQEAFGSLIVSGANPSLSVQLNRKLPSREQSPCDCVAHQLPLIAGVLRIFRAPDTVRRPDSADGGARPPACRRGAGLHGEALLARISVQRVNRRSPSPTIHRIRTPAP